MYIWLLLCQILTDLNNYCTAETRKMYKTGPTFTCLLRKESVSLLDQSFVIHAIDKWRRRLSASTYDCYSQNNNVEMVAQ